MSTASASPVNSSSPFSSDLNGSFLSFFLSLFFFDHHDGVVDAKTVEIVTMTSATDCCGFFPSPPPFSLPRCRCFFSFFLSSLPSLKVDHQNEKNDGEKEFEIDVRRPILLLVSFPPFSSLLSRSNPPLLLFFLFYPLSTTFAPAGAESKDKGRKHCNTAAELVFLRSLSQSATFFFPPLPLFPVRCGSDRW